MNVTDFPGLLRPSNPNIANFGKEDALGDVDKNDKSIFGINADTLELVAGNADVPCIAADECTLEFKWIISSSADLLNCLPFVDALNRCAGLYIVENDANDTDMSNATKKNFISIL